MRKEIENENVSNEEVENQELVSLMVKAPGCKGVNFTEITKWMENDGAEEITNDDIVIVVVDNNTFSEKPSIVYISQQILFVKGSGDI